MILGCKVSGEMLAMGSEPGGPPWSQLGMERSAEVIGATHAYVSEPNDHEATGAIFVVGGGNGGFRGHKLVEKAGMDPMVADQISMMGIAINARVISAALDGAGVDHDLLVAEGMRFGVPGLEVETATPGRVAVGLYEKRIVVIGGGSGIYGQSTDSAILDHLEHYRELTRNPAEPGNVGEPVLAFKATTFGGVFDQDPRLVGGDVSSLHRFERISTGEIRRLGLFALDLAGLSTIDRTGIPMMLHGFDVTPIEALQGADGTLVTPGSAHVTA
jgi:uridylate kinase